MNGWMGGWVDGEMGLIMDLLAGSDHSLSACQRTLPFFL